MELRQIEYFCMVGNLNSFTRAAERLHISQPSITQAIKLLEQELDIQLFDRSKKRTVLTLEGQAFLSRMENILNDLNQALAEAQEYKNLHRGTIKLGIPPMIGAYFFPDIFMCFKKNYPGLRLIISEEDSSLETTVKLETAALDLAIIILPERSDTIETLYIAPEQFVLCANPEHRLCRERSVSFSQLKNEPLIMLKEGSYQHSVVRNKCLRHSFMPNIIFSTSQVSTISQFVANGTGLSFLMEMVVKNNRNVTVIPLDEPITLSIGLAWKRNAYLSNAAKAFVDFIKDYKQKTRSPEDVITENNSFRIGAVLK